MRAHALALLATAAWAATPAIAQLPPPITPPASGSESITCFQSNVPKTCTSAEIAALAGTTGLESAHTFLAGPTSGTAVPTFRAIVPTDVPTLNQNTTGTAAGLSGAQTANYVYAAPNGSSGTASFRALVTADIPTGTSGSTIPLLSGANTWGNTQTVNGYLVLSAGASPLGMNISTNSGNARSVLFQTASSPRWQIETNGSAESGGNAGSDFQIDRFSDGGSYLDTPIAINRATGVVSIADGATGAYFKPTVADCANILQYGGDRTGTNDNTAAFAAAVAASQSGKICVYLPSGTYQFNSQQVVTLSGSSPRASVTIRGDGSEVTVLEFSSGTSGLSVQLNSAFHSFHIQDMSILSEGTTNVAGIQITQNASPVSNPANSPISDITSVTLRGSDGYGATNYWLTGINVTNASFINFVNDNVVGPLATTGTGVNLAGTSSDIGVVYNFWGFNSIYSNVGLFYGSYIQGVSITGSNFTGDNYGIATPASANGLAQLSVSSSQFNNNIAGFNLQTTPDGVQIVGNDFYLPIAGATGINLAAALPASIVGNTFHGLSTGQTGIGVLSFASAGVYIGGNVFRNMAAGINLTASSQYVTVGPNIFASTVTTPITNSGTNNTVAVSCSPGSPTSSFSAGAGLVTHC